MARRRKKSKAKGIATEVVVLIAAIAGFALLAEMQGWGL